MVKLFRLNFLIMFLLLGGCASFTRSPLKWDESVLYRHNLRFDVSGKNAAGKEIFSFKDKTAIKGMGILPPAFSYDIEVNFEPDMDFLYVRTVGREDPFERVGDSFKYTYKPNRVEADLADRLKFASFERDLNRPGFGLLLFKDPREKYSLPATLDCDGKTLQVEGTAHCHLAEKLIAWITFEHPVLRAPNSEECNFVGIDENSKPYPDVRQGKQFRFDPFPSTACELGYIEMEAPYRRLKLYLQPYKYPVVLGEETRE